MKKVDCTLDCKDCDGWSVYRCNFRLNSCLGNIIIRVTVILLQHKSLNRLISANHVTISSAHLGDEELP